MKFEYTYYYNNFQLTLPLENIYEMSAVGDQSAVVTIVAKELWHLKREINSIAIQKELKECGAWSEEQLSDSVENWKRILWITACNIKESDEFQDDTDKDENE